MENRITGLRRLVRRLNPTAIDRRGRSLDDVGESHDEENRTPDDAVVTADRERRIADARTSSIEAGRRKGGVAGAAMAGAMLAMRDIFDGPTKE